MDLDMNIKFCLTTLILLSSVTPTHMHASSNKQKLFVLGCSAAVVGYVAYKYLHSSAHKNTKQGIDEVDDEGLTALHRAIMYGCAAMVKKLLLDGANTEIATEDGYYPLHVAIMCNNFKITQLLLEHGANIKIIDKYESCLLCLALWYKRYEIAELLLKYGTNIDARCGECQLTALDNAIMFHDLQTVQWLLSWGANPNVRDSDDTTPLHCAADDGYVEIAKELLDHGANVNAIDKYGNTPLHRAVMSSSDYAKEVISVLIEYGAYVNARTSAKSMPLDLILQFDVKQKVEKIEKLIVAGADVNALSKFGSTVLDYAFRNNADEEIINLLKKKGAIRSTANSIVYDTAKKALISGDIEAKPTYLVRFLVDCAEQMEMGLDLLSNFCIDKLVKLFIDYGCDLNELYTFQEYVDVVDPDFPMVYRSEQKISILGIMGILPVFTQVLIDHGAKVCVNDFSALMSIAAIAQQTIQEKYQEMPEKFFEYDEISLGAAKAFVIMFKATTDQDRAKFLAQYPKIASFLKLT